MTATFSLAIPQSLKKELFRHLFPGDGDEHGAIVSAGLVKTDHDVRLLARELVCAIDGKDYLSGKRGYRMLTGEFVTREIRRCRDQELCYLAIHNHAGSDRVGFSADDLRSHERGYPSLLDIMRGEPVGALVFARKAVAGDLWLDKGTRLSLSSADVIGSSIERLYPAPQPKPPGVDLSYDRQARLFGDAGQVLLRRVKVGVVGAGGVGALVVQYLARLGIGSIVVADPERIEPSNLPRIVEATRWDALAPLHDPRLPHWIRDFAQTHSRRKSEIMRRIVRRANPTIQFEGIAGDFTRSEVARRFLECDFIFLAADSFQARLVFNAIVHQYLIPGVQIGCKVPVDAESGDVGEVHAVARPVNPDSGCLWCNGLIPPGRLQEEAATIAERRAQRYVEEETVVAPSVITLNAAAVGLAVNDFLFSVTALRHDSDRSDHYIRVIPKRRELFRDEPRKDQDCLECGKGDKSRFARGDSFDLPTR